MRDLFVRLPNHLGDTCMSLPALALLAQAGQSLVLVGKPWAVDLLAGCDLPVMGLPGSRRQRIATLRARRKALCGERAILLTNSFGSALEWRLAGFACAGYATDARSWLLAQALPVPAGWKHGMHMVEYYFELARHLTGSATRLPARLSLPLAASARLRASALLADAGVHEPYTMLCPAAAGLHHGRNKAWSGFARLCAALRARRVCVLAVPGPGERAIVRAALPGATLLPQTDLGTFAALLRDAQLVVANDSGPSHLAAAVGANLVCVFGVTDPVRTRPWTPDAGLLGSASGWPDFEVVMEAVGERLAAHDGRTSTR